ncbi:tyrosine-type recombinase/integrase [Vampirovibrio chlorellavorus]|uniref:tyrosine-type recombinase/integrase n=1 Tax=Vampirovibrio chlorellavorus TaxID=758823 RepID=UPI0026EC40DD|nr:site-specific integrase [Vampirovibrio chlorellavorus]
MPSFETRIDKNGKVSHRAKIRLTGFPAQSATFERKTDAKLWAQKTEAAIREGRYFKSSESSKRTLGQLIDKYIQVKLPLRGRDKETVGPQLRWWKSQLGVYLLKDVTPPLIVEQKDRLLQEPMLKKGQKTPRQLSNATVIRYLASLSVCFSYAVEDLGWLDSNPIKEIKKPQPERGRVRFLSDVEQERLLIACQSSKCPYLYTVVMLALLTGARYGEIMGLRWQDIDFERKTLLFEKTKNGERRSVAIVPLASQLLEALSKARRIDSPYVFARDDGKQPKDIRKQWEKAVKEANLADFRIHDLRHTAASYLAMTGASMLEIADILGHKTLSMVKRYSHLNDSHTAGVLKKMAEHRFGKSFE